MDSYVSARFMHRIRSVLSCKPNTPDWGRERSSRRAGRAFADGICSIRIKAVLLTLDVGAGAIGKRPGSARPGAAHARQGDVFPACRIDGHAHHAVAGDGCKQGQVGGLPIPRATGSKADRDAAIAQAAAATATLT